MLHAGQRSSVACLSDSKPTHFRQWKQFGLCMIHRFLLSSRAVRYYDICPYSEKIGQSTNVTSKPQRDGEKKDTKQAWKLGILFVYKFLFILTVLQKVMNKSRMVIKNSAEMLLIDPLIYIISKEKNTISGYMSLSGYKISYNQDIKFCPYCTALLNSTQNHNLRADWQHSIVQLAI